MAPDRAESLRRRAAELEQRLRTLGEERRQVEAELGSLSALLGEEKDTPPAEPGGPQSSDPLGGAAVVRGAFGAVVDAPTPSPPALTPTAKVALFRSLFRGRTDVFPRLWVNDRTKRKGYAPACGNEWVRGACEKPRVPCGQCLHQAFTPVTDAVVLAHLQGRHVIGVYPLLTDDTSWFVAVDFDKSGWRDDVQAFRETCREAGVPVAIERSRSGNGAHAWIFFSDAVTGSAARDLACHLLTETMARRPQLGLASYDRLFPSQDTLPKGGFGNLIALPLQHGPRQEGKTVFLDDALEPIADQWTYLAGIARMTDSTVQAIVARAGRAGRVIGVRRAAPEDAEGGAAPWEPAPDRAAVPRIPGRLPERVRATLAQRLFMEKAGLPPALVDHVQRLAAFQNPEFYKRQRLRLSTALTPRVIACAEDLGEYIALPRGCRADLEELLRTLGIPLEVEDRRTEGEAVSWRFQGELAPAQEAAASALLGHDTGIFVAPPGTGKTVLGAYLAARRGRSTLVLVHRRPLVDQWVAQLARFLGVDAKEVGRLGGSRRKLTGRLDVAMIQSLSRGTEINPVAGEYGHVIVDECHHVPAVSFERVMSAVRARFIVGLTATPHRRDGHHPILEMQLGPVRFAVDPRSRSSRPPFVSRLVVRETGFFPSDGRIPESIQDLYRLLATDPARNDLILDDVISSLEEGRSPLVLTERKDHLEFLREKLQRFARHLVVLQGGRTDRQQRETLARLASIPDTEERLVLATGRYIGEGFDDARLDTLFLTLPISWSGTVKQYAGRLQRLHGGKSEVRVVDYVDSQVGLLQKMFAKRLKTYRALGYVTSKTVPK